MPSLFLAHGAPTIAIERNHYTDFLRKLPETFAKPRAIVVFTAHWENPVQQIGTGSPDGSEPFSTIYDFHGFPPEMYELTYPAFGEHDLARDIQNRLAQKQIPSRIDNERGLDHGVWTLLKLLYPKADIPVVAMSVHPGLANEEQYRIGQQLAALREQDVLIIGSGGTVHNLRRIEWGGDKPSDWALAFDRWLEDRLIRWDTDSLLQYDKQAPHASDAVPRNEHFIPLLLAMGAGDPTQKAELLFREYQYGTLSLSAWQFA